MERGEYLLSAFWIHHGAAGYSAQIRGGACSRIRLTSDGKIRTCLFSHFDHDLYGVVARGGSDDDLVAFIQKTVETKEARHHIGEPGFLKPSRSMVHIGG